MGKRYYDNYDYEEAYKEQCKKLEEAEMERWMKEGWVNCLYRTSTYKSTNTESNTTLLESMVYPSFKFKADMPKTEKKRETSPSQSNLNDKNARRYLIRLANINFGKGDIWATFGWNNGLLPETYEDAKKDVKMLLSYDEEEIGSCMTTNYICIPEDLTIKQAMSELVKQAGENDNIMTIYVVDEKGVFAGAIDLKDLIRARENTHLKDLVLKSYPYVTDHEKIDDCMDRILDYAEDSIPVLSEDKRILGVITSEDLIEMVDNEMGEDYAKLAGLTAEEDLKEPIVQSMKKRLPWLIILLFLGMGVSSVVGLFENVVAVLPIVICFQSLVLDMAGNVGTQSLAVTIRVLMDENLTGKQKFQLVVKEVKTGSLNGILLGVMALLCLGVYVHFFKGYTWMGAFGISGCVGVSLLVAMAISSAVGTVIPMFFHKIKVDPAVASGPLITTVNDLVAVVTYYGMAWLLLIR